MIDQLRKTANYWVVALGVVFVTLFGGCQSGKKFTDTQAESGNMFHVGDLVTVLMIPVSMEKDQIPDHNERIGDDGKITLPYIGQITALGKTATQLQKEIHDLYVPQYYKGLTVTVHGEQRYFYVLGEVRAPGEKAYPGQMTVVKAITVAGGFTDFAKKTNVQLTHGGHTQIVNVDKAIGDPSYDFPVFPGDRINVKRRFW